MMQFYDFMILRYDLTLLNIVKVFYELEVTSHKITNRHLLVVQVLPEVRVVHCFQAVH